MIKISLITPTFNRADKLEEAIKSTLAQTYSHWEMIIVDDGSVDDTIVVVEKYIKADSRIKYVKNPGKGPASARNFGVQHSTGEYLAFLDDDDISLPHRFESQLNAIKKSGREYIVSGYEVRETETNRLIKVVVNELTGAGAGFPSRWMMTRTLFQKAGGFDESLFCMEDPEFSYRVAQYENFALHTSVVTAMYSTPGSLSSHLKEMLKGRIEMMKRVAHFMHPVEAAWWYIAIAMGFLRVNDYRQASHYLKKAKALNARKIYDVAYYYFLFAKHFNYGVLKKVNQKMLLTIAGYKFPKLVEHPLV